LFSPVLSVMPPKKIKESLDKLSIQLLPSRVSTEKLKLKFKNSKIKYLEPIRRHMRRTAAQPAPAQLAPAQSVPAQPAPAQPAPAQPGPPQPLHATPQAPTTYTFVIETPAAVRKQLNNAPSRNARKNKQRANAILFTPKHQSTRTPAVPHSISNSPTPAGRSGGSSVFPTAAGSGPDEPEQFIQRLNLGDSDDLQSHPGLELVLGKFGLVRFRPFLVKLETKWFGFCQNFPKLNLNQ
jgi:hypothetical protein